MFVLTRRITMDDLEPVITEEEWNEFVEEWNLETLEEPEKKRSSATLDMDDFFSRLENNW